MTPGLELPLLTLALLVLASFLAGWIDAVVGGGGLIQLPALLIGLPPDTPVATIAGTNKLPSFGRCAGRVERSRCLSPQRAPARRSASTPPANRGSSPDIG